MPHEVKNNTKLTEEEFQRFLQNVEEMDHKEDHSRAYRTLSNPIRRKLLEALDLNVMKIEDFLEKEEIDITEDQVKYHLSMLEQLNCVMDTESGWKITPRGLGFCKNAQLE